MRGFSLDWLIVKGCTSGWQEKQLVHKLFKVLVPRLESWEGPYTALHVLPTPFNERYNQMGSFPHYRHNWVALELAGLGDVLRTLLMPSESACARNCAACTRRHVLDPSNGFLTCRIMPAAHRSYLQTGSMQI